MACFLVPAAEALVVTLITGVVQSKEKKAVCTHNLSASSQTGHHQMRNIPFSRKLKWLSNLLWGGSFLLAFEHIWHGEVVPWFPFLTAASNPAEAASMLHEMSTVGVSMALLVTFAWVVMLLVSNLLARNVFKSQMASK